MLAIVLLFLLMYLTKALKIGELRCSSIYASADHYRNVRFSFVVYVTLKVRRVKL